MECQINQQQLKTIYELFTNVQLNKISQDLCQYLHDNIIWNKSTEKMVKGYKIVSIYGQGSYGVVLKMCKGDEKGHCKAFKMLNKPSSVDEKNELIREVKIQEFLAKASLAPYIDPHVGEGVLYINKKKAQSVVLLKMDPIDNILFERIIQGSLNAQQLSIDLLIMIKKKLEQGIVHGDMHSENIAIVKGKIVLIDFGLSRTIQSISDSIVDYIPLIGHLYFKIVLNKKYSKETKLMTRQVIDLLITACNEIHGTQFVLKNFNVSSSTGYSYKITKLVSINSYKAEDEGGIKGKKN